MSGDWRLFALALAFVGWMATDKRVSRKRLRLAGLLIVAIGGSAKVLPMIAAGFAGPDQAATWGPVSVILNGGGQDAGDPPVGGVYRPPSAPICDAVVFAATGDSLRVSCSAFDGDGDDTHVATAILVDTAGGDFSAPQYFADTLGAITADTIPALDSASVVDILVAYEGDHGGWSDYDTIAGVEMVSSGVDVLFHSDWSTATGTGTDAWLDTDKSPLEWSDDKDSNGGTIIVTAASTGRTWPAGMSNVMQIWNLAAGSPVQGVRNLNRFTVPPTGDSIAWRWYFSQETPDSYTADDQTHSIQDGEAGGGTTRNWALRIYNNSGAGVWCPEFYFPGDQLGGTANTYVLSPGGGSSCSAPLPKDSVFMFELLAVLDSDSTFIPLVKISEVDGTLLYDSDDFNKKNGTGTTNLGSRIGHNLQIGDSRGMNDLQVGSNGWSNDPASDFLAFLWGGVAICRNGWCGPYPIAGVEN